MSASQFRIILHVDDDDDDRQMFKDGVKEIDRSIDVWVAKTGTEGLEILRQGLLINKLPHLIILDLNLPGMDGKIVLREIKKEKTLSTIPIAILTTSSAEMDKMFADKEGVPLFTKPSCEAEFFGVVQHILERSISAKNQ